MCTFSHREQDATALYLQACDGSQAEVRRRSLLMYVEYAIECIPILVEVLSSAGRLVRQEDHATVLGQQRTWRS